MTVENEKSVDAALLLVAERYKIEPDRIQALVLKWAMNPIIYGTCGCHTEHDNIHEHCTLDNFLNGNDDE